MQQALTYGWGEALRAALLKSNALFHTPLPAGMESLDQHKPIRPVAQQACKRIGTRTLNVWQTGKSLGGRARLFYIWLHVFPTPAYVRHRYHPHPAWMWPLYYLYRWADLFLDILSTLSVEG